MTTPDPKTVREIARKFLLDPHMTASDLKACIRDHIGTEAPDEVFSAWHDAVKADARKGVVETVASWPDEQQPADVVTAEQQQDGAAGRLAALLSHLDEISRRAQRARPGDTRTERQILADFVRQSVEPEQLREALRVVLAERTALAARVAELESERDGDARAVEALLAAEVWDVIGTAHARSALRNRFADRIAALTAAETEES